MSGETVDALEEIKRMTEGLRTGIKTGISESATNQNTASGNTDTAAARIDLKI